MLHLIPFSTKQIYLQTAPVLHCLAKGKPRNELRTQVSRRPKNSTMGRKAPNFEACFLAPDADTAARLGIAGGARQAARKKWDVAGGGQMNAIDIRRI